MRTRNGLLVAATAITAACGDVAAPELGFSSAALSAALATAPAGYGDLSSSYVGREAEHADSGEFHMGGGRGAGMGHGAMMGGGMHDAFTGGMEMGHGRGHRGPFGGGLGCRDGAFSAATGRVECPAITMRNGLTVVRSAAYASASGAVQQAFDTLTTNTVNMRAAVTGTIVWDSTMGRRGRGRDDHGGDNHGGRGGPAGMLLGDTAQLLTARTTVSHASDRTVTGLAQGSAARTTNGGSRGTEVTAGTTTRGAFTATRTIADTTTGLVIPVRTGDTRPYPTAGTVARSMSITLDYAGQPRASVSRREVVTYDGTATAKVVITQNGTTRTCTRALPRGELVCQ